MLYDEEKKHLRCKTTATPLSCTYHLDDEESTTITKRAYKYMPLENDGTNISNTQHDKEGGMSPRKLEYMHYEIGLQRQAVSLDSNSLQGL